MSDKRVTPRRHRRSQFDEIVLPVIKVDLKLKARWEAALRRLKTAKRWHARYAAAAEILRHDPPLYLAGRISSDREFIARELKESRPSAYRNMRVAQLATERQVERFTASRLELAITYIEAKTGRALERRGDINFERLRVDAVALDQVSHRELRAKVAALKAQRRGADALLAELAAVGLKNLAATVRNDQLVLRAPLSGLAAVARTLAERRAMVTTALIT